MPTKAESRMTTDHDEIRRWAEERNAKPACVRVTGGRGDTGMLRLDFPGYSGEGKLQPISWDDWFEKFDERNLALLYQETTASGQPSNFNKLVSRETGRAVRNGGTRRAASGSHSRSARTRGSGATSRSHRSTAASGRRSTTGSSRRASTRSSQASSTRSRSRGSRSKSGRRSSR